MFTLGDNKTSIYHEKNVHVISLFLCDAHPEGPGLIMADVINVYDPDSISYGKATAALGAMRG